MKQQQTLSVTMLEIRNRKTKNIIEQMETGSFDNNFLNQFAKSESGEFSVHELVNFMQKNSVYKEEQQFEETFTNLMDSVIGNRLQFSQNSYQQSRLTTLKFNKNEKHKKFHKSVFNVLCKHNVVNNKKFIVNTMKNLDNAMTLATQSVVNDDFDKINDISEYVKANPLQFKVAKMDIVLPNKQLKDNEIQKEIQSFCELLEKAVVKLNDKFLKTGEQKIYSIFVELVTETETRSQALDVNIDVETLPSDLSMVELFAMCNVEQKTRKLIYFSSFDYRHTTISQKRIEEIAQLLKTNSLAFLLQENLVRQYEFDLFINISTLLARRQQSLNQKALKKQNLMLKLV